MFKDIPGSDQWVKIDFVDKGWSEDKKYHIQTEAGDHLLLRISRAETYAVKKQEYEIIQKISALDFEMSIPYDLGLCEEGVYMVMAWIQGQDMEEVLPLLSLQEQYDLGLEAGKILKDIHALNLEFEVFDWYEKFSRKIDRKIEMYRSCELKYEKGDLFIDYINQTRDLLRGRPLCLHHGDFHVGNMIYTKTKHVGVIDFNRFDYGDPWEEFNRIVWDAQTSPAFASGRLDGYFDGDVPHTFFKLLALYISSNTLSSLPWAIPFGQKDIEVMTNQAADNLYAYEDFKRVIPRWYTETKEKMNKK
jgi:aminoglycoside phosphotransferase (APT) family kinase protein